MIHRIALPDAQTAPIKPAEPAPGTTMKRCLIAILLGVLAAPAFAYQPDPDESQLREHHHYTNRDGQAVHSPAHSRNGGVAEWE